MPEEESTNSLWPAFITPGLMSPYLMLRDQAEALREQTGGLLTAPIERSNVAHLGGEFEHLVLRVAAPSISYSVPIATLLYRKLLPYPLVIDAEAFGPSSKHLMQLFREGKELGPGEVELAAYAASSKELRSALGRVFKSYQVATILESLIARVNEELAASPLKPGKE